MSVTNVRDVREQSACGVQYDSGCITTLQFSIGFSPENQRGMVPSINQDRSEGSLNWTWRDHLPDLIWVGTRRYHAQMHPEAPMIETPRILFSDKLDSEVPRIRENFT